MIGPKDDYFHPRNDDLYWNESAWFGFNIPERSLSGFVYFYHRPNMKYSVGGVALWDPSGEQIYDCLYYDFGHIYPMAESWDMYDFSLPNGLTVECVKPLSTFKLTYRGNNSYYEGIHCKMDLVFEAFLPPHQTGQPEGQQEWAPASQHYEQPGKMKGTIEIGGETLKVDSWSMRDHSWGVRKLSNNNRGYFPWGIASEKSGFQVYAMSDVPPEQDPVNGTTLRIAAGWYLRDGVYGSLTSGECVTTERRPDGRPLRMEMSATDSLGRKLHVTGRAKNVLTTVLYPFMMQWWVQFEWELDGATCHGENMDFFPVQHARQFIRSLK